MHPHTWQVACTADAAACALRPAIFTQAFGVPGHVVRCMLNVRGLWLDLDKAAGCRCAQGLHIPSCPTDLPPSPLPPLQQHPCPAPLCLSTIGWIWETARPRLNSMELRCHMLLEKTAWVPTEHAERLAAAHRRQACRRGWAVRRLASGLGQLPSTCADCAADFSILKGCNGWRPLACVG